MYIDFFGFPVTSVLTTFFAIIWSCLILIGTKTSILISLVFYSLFRTFLVTFTFAYIADSLGFHYFGILAGTVFLLGGVVGLFQYPLKLLISGTCHREITNHDATSSISISTISSICSKGYWYQVNILMLISFLILIIFSYRDYIRRKLNNRVLNDHDEVYLLNQNSRSPPIQSRQVGGENNKNNSNTKLLVSSNNYNSIAKQ